GCGLELRCQFQAAAGGAFPESFCSTGRRRCGNLLGRGRCGTGSTHQPTCSPGSIASCVPGPIFLSRGNLQTPFFHAAALPGFSRQGTGPAVCCGRPPG